MPTVFDNMQPAMRLNVELGLFGIYPSQGGGSNGGIYMGMYHTYAFGFSPGSGARAALGQLLPISQNDALFSLIGTFYGGDGQTSFALPNLNGRLLEGVGQGVGLSPVLTGQVNGSTNSTLAHGNYPTSIGGPAQPLDEDGPSLGGRYFIATSGVFPSRDGSSGALNYVGSITQAAFDFVPSGYLACEGQLLSIAQNEALFFVIGTTYGGDGESTFALPDLRGRTVVGAGGDYLVGQTFGSESVTLSNANLPVNMGGLGQAIDNHEPSIALTYAISLSGIYPSNGGNGSPDPEIPYIGEIITFAGNFIPSGFAACDGRLLSIAQNDVLFTLIGTTFGGDGQLTFALPDLRGRSIAGVDASFNVGTLLGTDGLTLTSADFGDLTYSGDNTAGLHYGGDGNDFISGLGGTDQLFGNKGNDLLSGGTNGDKLDGGEGNDTADYRTSSSGIVNVSLLANTASGGDALGDTLISIENLFGSLVQRDILIGNNADNVLKGFGGIDSLRGEDGNDFIEGGAGGDAINGGAGIHDVASYRDSTVGNVSINLLTNTYSGGDAQGDTLFFIEDLDGSLTNRDILIGNDLNNIIQGFGGVDSIRGEGGNDILDGGAGADSLNAGAGIDTVTYARSTAGVTINLNVALQTSAGDANGDSLFFVENVTGSDLIDSITGNYLTNRLVGGGGADTLDGGTGSDYLTGGADADTFRFSDLSFGSDTILDWQDGLDKISIALPLETSFAGLTFTGQGTTAVLIKGFNGTGSALLVKADAAFTLDVGDFVFV